MHATNAILNEHENARSWMVAGGRETDRAKIISSACRSLRVLLHPRVSACVGDLQATTNNTLYRREAATTTTTIMTMASSSAAAAAAKISIIVRGGLLQTLFLLLVMTSSSSVVVYADRGGSFTHTIPYGSEECLLIRVPKDRPSVLR